MNQPQPQPVAPAVAEPSALSAAVPLQDGQSLSLGLMMVGDAMVALPNAQLSEVVACPSRLHPLPLPVPGLQGSVDLRGLAVPVIDLRFLMGLAPRDAGAPGAVIVIMRFDGNLLGLLVDRIVGIARVAPGDLVPLVVLQPAGARIASHSVLLPSGHATVLDAGRIAALPDLPLVPEPTISCARRRADLQALLVMHCAGFAVAIDALDIAATVSPMEIRPSALCSTLCRGVFTHQGHEIPVVDTAVLLGLGQRAEEAPTVVLVMPLDQGPGGPAGGPGAGHRAGGRGRHPCSRRDGNPRTLVARRNPRLRRRQRTGAGAGWPRAAAPSPAERIGFDEPERGSASRQP